MTRPIDENGWMVPRDGTKSKLIYGLARAGLKATAMQKFMPEGTSLGTIRVLLCKIKHPKPQFRDRQRFASVSFPPSR